MAKFTKKEPKKPKSTASLATIQEYIRKKKDYDNEKKAYEKNETLRKTLLKRIREGKTASVGAVKRKKTAAKKTTTRKAAKKTTKRKR
jgi:hypothetical protein